MLQSADTMQSHQAGAMQTKPLADTRLSLQTSTGPAAVCLFWSSSGCPVCNARASSTHFHKNHPVQSLPEQAEDPVILVPLVVISDRYYIMQLPPSILPAPSQTAAGWRPLHHYFAGSSLLSLHLHPEPASSSHMVPTPSRGSCWKPLAPSPSEGPCIRSYETSSQFRAGQAHDSAHLSPPQSLSMRAFH